MLDFKVLALFCILATIASASVYEVPIIVQHLDSLHYDEDLPVKSYVVVPAKRSKVYVPAQNVIHPALSSYHYPVQKYTVQYPSGLYHGPHGVGIYDPKFHDELEQAYYNSK